MIWPNGDKYIGEWKEGRMHGTGVYVAASGNRYEVQLFAQYFLCSSLYCF